MEICAKREWELLNKIAFVRFGGSGEELKAAHILLDELASFGVKGEIEPFEVPNYEIKNVKLEVLEPEYREYTVRGYGLTGNTPAEGITAELVYVEQAEKVNLLDVKGKIVLVNRDVHGKTYKNLLDAGAAGFISVSGTVIDEEDKTDIEMRVLEELELQYDKLPGVTMRAKDALNMLKSGAKKVRLTLQQDEWMGESRNVMAEIPGTDYPEEVIVFVAHYDSMPFSPGVYDNGGGDVINMEMIRHFAKNPPKRTLRFIWCGSEERGLLGSVHYVNAHHDALKDIVLCINVDMAGPVIGSDRAIITADNSLKDMVDYLAGEVGHPITTSQNTYSSDAIPFGNKGIPAINFARFGANGTAPGHNRYDILDHLSPESFRATTEFIGLFCERIVNSVIFPVPREIPDNMVKAIDRYMDKYFIEANKKKD